MVTVVKRHDAEGGSCSDPQALIAVMGPTGSGKSTFINLVSGSHLAVGKGLRSCTDSVQIGSSFGFAGRQMVLIDTPGFDDTTVSDIDVLNMICVYLAQSYEAGRKLTGVIYMHRIIDPRVGGKARQNFSMFHSLCGDDNPGNVLIVTTMWNRIEQSVGEEREALLRSDELFFKSMLDRGAQMARHDNTIQSAQAILARFVQQVPQPLRIQRELVDERKSIAETAAGMELDRALALLVEQHTQELDSFRREMANAVALHQEGESRAKQELQRVQENLEEKIKSLTTDRERLSNDYEQLSKDNNWLKEDNERLSQDVERLSEISKLQQSKLADVEENLTTLLQREQGERIEQIENQTAREQLQPPPRRPERSVMPVLLRFGVYAVVMALAATRWHKR